MTRIEALTREAAALPRTERLELVRALLELDGGAVAEAEETWDEEIRARVQAVDEGRAASVSLDDLRREIDGRLGA
jgi:putative addiction module component (TIGR02574 family)